MTAAGLHEKLVYACKGGSIEDVAYWLDAGADPNFNLRIPINALDSAIQRDNREMVELLLERGAVIKEFVLQKAIEKDKNYLDLLIPDFKTCQDETLLMGVLRAAMNIDDLEMAGQAIEQGANPQKLVLYGLRGLNSTEILELLVENGFNIHAENNIIVTDLMGSSLQNWMGALKHDLLAFIASYYLDKPDSIEKFKTLRIPDKLRLFREGLGNNDLKMMKFALRIGANENEALVSALYRYNASQKGDISTTHAERYKNNKSGWVDYDIIEYLLGSDIDFNKETISSAVCFKYTQVLEVLSRMDDLEYGYEMACKYDDEHLQDYFRTRGVSKKAQSFAQMKIAAIKGDVKALRQAVNDGAKLEELDTAIIVEIINKNQVDSLKYLYDSGKVFESALNDHLNKAMSYHKAFDTVSYLVELGFDISTVKNLSPDYKKKYPIIADMWSKRFGDIFDYTMYLAKEVYPKAEGKEKEKVLERVAALSSLPYVLKKSQERV